MPLFSCWENTSSAAHRLEGRRIGPQGPTLHILKFNLTAWLGVLAWSSARAPNILAWAALMRRRATTGDGAHKSGGRRIGPQGPFPKLLGRYLKLGQLIGQIFALGRLFFGSEAVWMDMSGLTGHSRLQRAILRFDCNNWHHFYCFLVSHLYCW